MENKPKIMMSIKKDKRSVLETKTITTKIRSYNTNKIINKIVFIKTIKNMTRSIPYYINLLLLKIV